MIRADKRTQPPTAEPIMRYNLSNLGPLPYWLRDELQRAANSKDTLELARVAVAERLEDFNRHPSLVTVTQA